jgi:polyhydroxyalkanoate synthesis regulator phasin
MVEVVAIIACATIIIVILTYSKDLLEGKRRTRIKAIEKESVRMQADISELNVECRKLRKKVAGLQEQIAELYIEHHNKP